MSERDGRDEGRWYRPVLARHEVAERAERGRARPNTAERGRVFVLESGDDGAFSSYVQSSQRRRSRVVVVVVVVVVVIVVAYRRGESLDAAKRQGRKRDGRST